MPVELHNLHSDYHLALKKIEIKESMLSDNCRKINSFYNFSVGGVKKLVPSLNYKNK